MPSPDVDNYFLKVFGQPARETACQCERSSDSNLSQALQMINGPLVHAKVRDEKNRLRTLVAAGKNDQEVISELYLAALSRPPSEAELAAATRHIAASRRSDAGAGRRVLGAVERQRVFVPALAAVLAPHPPSPRGTPLWERGRG